MEMESKSWKVLVENCANIKQLQQWMHQQSHLLGNFWTRWRWEQLQLLATLGHGSTIATSKLGHSSQLQGRAALKGFDVEPLDAKWNLLV